MVDAIPTVPPLNQSDYILKQTTQHNTIQSTMRKFLPRSSKQLLPSQPIRTMHRTKEERSIRTKFILLLGVPLLAVFGTLLNFLFLNLSDLGFGTTSLNEGSSISSSVLVDSPLSKNSHAKTMTTTLLTIATSNR